MSYVNKKIRAFREAGDTQIERKRSDARMKSYQSATDARAWCDSIEQRRQHILELIRQGGGKGLSLGKYIPIEAIIDILLAQKNADIKRLEWENENLRKFIRDHGLHYEEVPLLVTEPSTPMPTPRYDSDLEETPRVAAYTAGGAAAGVEESGEAEETAISADAAKRAADDAAKKAAEEEARKAAEEAARKASEDAKQLAASEDAKGLAASAAVEVTPSTVPEPGPTLTGAEGASDAATRSGAAEVKPKTAEVGPRTAEVRPSAAEVRPSTAEVRPSAAEVRPSTAEVRPSAAEVRPSAAGVRPSASARPSAAEVSPSAAGVTAIEAEEQIVTPPTDYEVPATTASVTAKPSTAAKPSAYGVGESSDEGYASPAEAAIVGVSGARLSPEEERQAVAELLAEKEAFCENSQKLAAAAIEQLENIKEIVDERDELKEQLQKSQREVQSLKKTTVTTPAPPPSSIEADACQAEIEALERQIEDMRNGALSPEQEADIVRREVEIIKKYCAKMTAVQNENMELRNQLKQGGSDCSQMTQERDRLKLRVQQLERELSKYGSLPEEIETFKEKAQELEPIDKKDLQKRFDRLHGLEDEVRALKRRANQCGKGDDLQSKVKDLEKQIECLRCKCKEAEILRVERNCLKMRLEDLSHVQRDYECLLEKTKGFEALKAECALYKTKYDRLEELERECEELRAKVQRCTELENERQLLMKEIEDCECCMNNQDSEIKRLACHIECLTNDLDSRQDQMKTKVVSMRAHLEKKDIIIAKSEQKLADVQDELRSSIEQVTCDTACLKNRIDQLETQMCCKDSELKETKCCYNKLLQDYEKEKTERERLEDELGRSITNDEHLKLMLKQAKCAVKCITQKLQKYEIGDISKLETERENLKIKLANAEKEICCLCGRVQELEEEMAKRPCGADRIEELEEELRIAKQTIKCLQCCLENSKPLTVENEALKRHSSQLQQIAKEHVSKLESDKDLSRKNEDDLRAQINALKAQLEKEKKMREVAEDAVKSLGDDSTEAKLRKQIDVLNAEIDRLNFELEKLRKESQDAIQREKKKSTTQLGAVSQCEDEVDKLKKDLEGKAAESRKIEDENKRLKDELDKLRQELENAKKSAGGNTKQLQDEIERLKADLAAKSKPAEPKADFSKERDELLKQIQDQKKEIADLLNKIKQPTAGDSDNATFKELEMRTKENENLKKTIDDLERQLRELQKAPQVPQPSGELENAVSQMTKRLEEEEKRNKELEEALKKCQEEKEKKEEKKEEKKRRKSSIPQPPKKLSIDVTQKMGKEECDKKIKELEDELAKQKKECSDMLASLKDQYERDIKNLHKKNEESIEKLQKTQQEQIRKMSEVHEDELSGLKTELKKSEVSLKKLSDDKISLEKQVQEKQVQEKPVEEKPVQEKKVSISENVEDQPKKDEKRKPSLTMKTFDVCTCGKLPTVIPISTVEAKDTRKREPCKCEQSPKQLQRQYPCQYMPPPPMQMMPPPPQMQMMPPHPQMQMMQPPPQIRMPQLQPQHLEPIMLYEPTKECPQKDEKILSMKKIVELENKLLVKQQQTKQKIELLSTNVDRFKRELELEKQKNNDLICRYTTQQKTVANMRVEMDLVKRENIQDKKKLQQLNYTLQKIIEDNSSHSMCGGSIQQASCGNVQILRAIPPFRTEMVPASRGSVSPRCVRNSFESNE